MVGLRCWGYRCRGSISSSSSWPLTDFWVSRIRQIRDEDRPSRPSLRLLFTSLFSRLHRGRTLRSSATARPAAMPNAKFRFMTFLRQSTSLPFWHRVYRASAAAGLRCSVPRNILRQRLGSTQAVCLSCTGATKACPETTIVQIHQRSRTRSIPGPAPISAFRTSRARAQGPDRAPRMAASGHAINRSISLPQRPRGWFQVPLDPSLRLQRMLARVQALIDGRVHYLAWVEHPTPVGPCHLEHRSSG